MCNKIWNELKQFITKVMHTACALLCSGVVWYQSVLPIWFRINSLPPGQSYDNRIASEPNLGDMESWYIRTNKNMHISWGILYGIFRFLAAMIYFVDWSFHCEGVLSEWCDMALPWHHLHNGLPRQQKRQLYLKTRPRVMWGPLTHISLLCAECYEEMQLCIIFFYHF